MIFAGRRLFFAFRPLKACVIKTWRKYAGLKPVLEGDGSGLYPMVGIAFVKPFIREAALAGKCRIISPANQLLIGLLNSAKDGCIAALIRMMGFCLSAVGTFYDSLQLGRIQVGAPQIEKGQ
jgi:hypothetical protein